MRRWITPAIALAMLAALLHLGVRGFGPVPPLGALLDPAQGAWALAAAAEHPALSSADIPGLKAPVRIVYDDRAVPHIFAESELDAYRALGWAVARDRLFQMELQARAGNGTLTQLVGTLALEVDREARALGLGRGAEVKAAAVDGRSAEWRALEAYADGVNAWIDAMPPGALPLEYRLVGARPSRWEPRHSIQLMQRMGWTLAYGEEEIVRMRARSLVGAVAADALFPVHSPIQEPIQPTGRAAPRLEGGAIPPPGVPDASAALALSALTAFGTVRATREGDVVGSNSWAVAPARTRDGYALLAGDPHLELTLPSIWYEAHLVVPGRLDVYGVTIPGAPLILIGFNRDIAWTFTNTQADVLDLYREAVDDEDVPTRYRVDNEWRRMEERIEEYRDHDGALLATDTVRYTHRGPLRRVDGQWLSMRWTVLEPGNELEALFGIMRATSVRSHLEAAAGYASPAQNMLVADRSGSIAIRSTGRYPLRPADGRGDVIRDGTRSDSDWTGAWPVARYPQAVDPPQGFLASANQQPIDPAVDSGYLGAMWPAPWRALRINELLRANARVSADDMRRMQTDGGSARADWFVPAFLDAARARAEDGSASLARAAALLGEWDRRYVPESRRAVLFEEAMQQLSARLWDELQVRGTRSPSPSDVVAARLLAQPESPWWDVRETPAIERRDDVLAMSLASALDLLTRAHGEPESDEWLWSRRRQTRITHAMGIGALGAPAVPARGGPSTISPSAGSGRHGASWRMVVELGPQVKGWGVYPGGQSGNPVSRRYRDGVSRWGAGELDSLRFPRSADELPHSPAQVILRPPRSAR